MSQPTRPSSKEWVAAVYAGYRESAPIGSGILLSPGERVLTCAHVAWDMLETGNDDPLPDLWVAFPMSPELDNTRFKVVHAEYPDFWRDGTREYRKSAAQDLAVLYLAESAGADRAARIRRPAPGLLEGRSWWAAGFRDPTGDESFGIVRNAVGFGQVRLETTSSEKVAGGYSGAGLWCAEYGAVVGMIARTDLSNTEVRAISVDYAARSLPGTWLGGLCASLQVDELDVDTHWLPRAGGGSTHFQGRWAALERINGWLAGTEGSGTAGGALIVTGSAGTGKSSVLSRVVVTSDPALGAKLPADDSAPRVMPGSVQCAVHAKGKTALEVARELARAASAPLPESVALTPELTAPAATPGRPSRLTVVLDALDEATADQAHLIIRDIVNPLTRRNTGVRVQFLIGIRTSEATGSLIELIENADVIDLDDPRYAEAAGLAAHIEENLPARSTTEIPGPDRAALVAEIASRADHNFLVAEVEARSQQAIGPATPEAPERTDPAVPAANRHLEELGRALLRLIEQIESVGGHPAGNLLTALAFAQAPGFTAPLWSAAVGALFPAHPAPEPADLRRFAATPAAAALVTASTKEPGSIGEETYQLYHQAFGESLTQASEAGSDPGPGRSAELVARALLRAGRDSGWAAAPQYLLRAMPQHALLGGFIDELLAEDDYLLHADLHRLTSAADAAATDHAMRRAELLRKSRGANDAGPARRAAQFSVTEAQERLGESFGYPGRSVPYRAVWAHVVPRAVEVTLGGHTQAVTALCTLSDHYGATVLASGGQDSTIRIWGEYSIKPLLTLQHGVPVSAVCAVATRTGGSLLVSAGTDGTVRVWNPRDEHALHELPARDNAITALCGIHTDDGGALVASGGPDGTVRVFDPCTGADVASLGSQESEIVSLCAIPGSAQRPTLLAAGGFDGVVRLWSTADWSSIPAIRASGSQGLLPLCALDLGAPDETDSVVLAVGGPDAECRLYDPWTGDRMPTTFDRPGEIVAMCALPSRTTGTLLAVADDQSRVRVWDPRNGALVRVLVEESEQAKAICALTTAGGRTLLALGVNTKTIRLWDPGVGLANRPTTMRSAAKRDHVHALCRASDTDGSTTLAAVGADPVVRIYDARHGEARQTLADSTELAIGRAVCTVPGGDGRELIAVGGEGRDVVLWSPSSNRKISTLSNTRSRAVRALCAVPLDHSTTLLASAGEADHVQLWNPANAARMSTLRDRRDIDTINALCVVPATATPSGRRRNRGTLLAAAAEDGTIHLWETRDWTPAEVLTGHERAATALCVLPSAKGRPQLCSSGADGTIRAWDTSRPDGASGRSRVLGRLSTSVEALCTVVTGSGRTLLASGGEDRTVRLWDPANSEREPDPVLEIPVWHRVRCLAAFDGLLCVGHTAGILALSIP